MIYRWLKKFRNVICLIIMFCIVIPFASACGNVDNGLTENKPNPKIGVGGDIEAYTTYRTAPLKKMTQTLYYSYLMNYRPFILVVVEDNAVTLDSNGNVSSINYNNDMLVSASSGVFPYTADFSAYSNYDLKVLMYYVTISEFKDWEQDSAADDDFVSKAFDFVSPSGSLTIESSEEYSPRHFKCHKVVNMGGNLSSIYDEGSGKYLGACDLAGGSHSIFNVNETGETNKEKGIVLFYGNGSLEGFIRNSDITGKMNGSLTIDEYFSRIMSLIPTNNTYLLSIFKEFSNNSKASEYKSDEGYKVLFDVAILSRISKLNEFTKLDFSSNDASFNNTYLLSNYEIKKVGQSDMGHALNGVGAFSNKSYVAFVTADGFVHDRGDIVSTGIGATIDAGLAMVLEELMRMDACPNATVVKYIADIISSGAIFAGGAILLACIFSAPFPGARIVGAALLLAGLIYKAVASGAAASDKNYCEIYEELLVQLKKDATFAVPVITYNIDKGNEDVYLCTKTGVEYDQCPSGNRVSLYHYADLEQAESFGLDGMPYLGFYHEGKLVDKIYGIADPNFISEILSSWGVMVTGDNKYVATYKDDKLNILDRGRTDNTRDEISYCFSFEYNGECFDSYVSLPNKTFNGGNNFNTNNTVNVDLSSRARDYIADDLERSTIDISGYKDVNSYSEMDEYFNNLENIIDTQIVEPYKTNIMEKYANVKARYDSLSSEADNYKFVNESIGLQHYVIDDKVLIDGKLYTFDSDLKILSYGGNVISEDSETGYYVIDEVNYSLEYSVFQIPFTEIKDIISQKIKDEFNGVEYYKQEVSTFINVKIKEHFNKPQGEAVKDEKTNKPCDDSMIRVNRIWGNFMCWTDKKWYHIESNWVVPSKEKHIEYVYTDVSAEYVRYESVLKFELQ